MNPQLSQLQSLSFSEKLQLVEDLWDDLAAMPEALPVHEWQRAELAKREVSHTENPDAAVSWKEAQRRIRQQDD